MLLVPQKVDSCVREFAKSPRPGRNSKADVFRFLTRTTSPHRNRNSFPARRLVHEVMTLATFSGLLIRSASSSSLSSSSWASEWPTDPITAASFVSRQTGTSESNETKPLPVASYQSHLSFPLPPIPVLNIVTNLNDADDKEIEYMRGVCAIKTAYTFFTMKRLANYVII